jgi:ATP-dependent DNA helicase RecG
LPFHPTDAQKRVLKEIVDDLRSPHPMNRLLQGDVGSGKTIVAAEAALIAVDNGWQVAVMAPTELLAEQHAVTFARLLEPLGIRTALLSRATPASRRAALRRALGAGDLHLLIGTHALIQNSVEFASLGLVIIDEQHRFGVLQRSALIGKGDNVDTLIMTATPIPRSLAMTLYGDLDVSVIDQSPPGRRPIRTLLVPEAGRAEAYQLLEAQLGQGRQAYVVYPLVDESEKIDLRAVSRMADELRARFPTYKVGALHGRLKAQDKQALMSDFSSGRIQILASTTVVEVGIDVPNATVMVVEHADRFGLSQLHQLRGRVGRGADQSFCLLLSDPETSAEGWERLGILEKTADGFVIAEKDLELRGPGEFAGTRQSGVPLFRHGNLVRDIQIMRLARDEAAKHMEGLKGPEREAYAAAMGALWKTRFQLSLIG